MNCRHQASWKKVREVLVNPKQLAVNLAVVQDLEKVRESSLRRRALHRTISSLSPHSRSTMMKKWANTISKTSTMLWIMWAKSVWVLT